jgi:peptidoglycan/xylan/chitin deacetylase (PgdA/CDA1 family)
MPAERLRGVMDNPYYDWSPISRRQPLKWPGNAHVAVCVIVHIEHAEWLPPAGTIGPPSLVHRRPYPEIPDVHEVSPHEYGNRVGIFRVMRILDDCQIRATAAIDAAAATIYPYLVQEGLKRGWEFIGHGIASSRMISERMTESDEREYIRRSLEAVKNATGTIPAGWASVEYGESSRTVRLLAEHGVRYVCDWPNDEQPYWMKVPVGRMLSLPVMIELDDIFSVRMRGLPAARLSQMMKDAFDRLYKDGSENGRLLVLSVHPWLTGQPFRIKYLADALQYITEHEKVWVATGREIVDWYTTQTP